MRILFVASDMSRSALIFTGVGLALIGCQSPQPIVVSAPNGMGGQGLVLSGTATVRVKPTLVVLKLGASFSDVRPVEAKSKTDKTITAILAALKKAGVPAEDVQTTSFKLAQNDPQQGGGWRCSSALEIRVKEVESASRVLQAAILAGANQINQVEYTVEELQEVRAKARDEACKVAKDKAEQYAQNFGLKLGSPIYIEENSPRGWFYGANTMTQSMSVGENLAGGRESDQVLSSGSVEVMLTVNVTYALPQK